MQYALSEVIGNVGPAAGAGRMSRDTFHGGVVYTAPKLERLGTLRDLTLAGGDFAQADAVNPYHRYTQIG